MKAFIPLFAIALMIGLIANTNAELIDNHDGTVTQIRDDGSRLMWLKDANYADTSGYRPGGCFIDPNWKPDLQTDAQDWIDYLNYLPSPTPGPSGYAGYSDWRLPSHQTRDGSQCGDYYCSETELGYMYYIELGNDADFLDEVPTNTGPFENLRTEDYVVYWQTLGCFNFGTGKSYTPVYHVSVTYPGGPGVIWPVRDLEPIQLPGPPTACAGKDQKVFDEITLDGSESFDLDGRIVTYEWNLTHRSDAAHNRTASGMTPTVSGLEPGHYDVVLAVTDNDGATDTDMMIFIAIGIKGDLNFDGDIDGDDLSEFADVFGGSN